MNPKTRIAKRPLAPGIALTALALLCACIAAPARAALSFVQSFGSLGSGSGQFRGPFGVTVDSAGNVYVADGGNNRIDRFHPANIAGTFTSFGSGKVYGPWGVALDRAGNVYVASTDIGQIDSFNPADFAGTFASFGSAGSGNGQFYNPVGVTVDGAGNVYVADTNNNQIVELTGAAVPEPSTLSLLGLSVMGLLRRRRR